MNTATSRRGLHAMLIAVLLPMTPPAADGAATSASAKSGGGGAPTARRHETGIASIYAKMLDGRETASGEAHASDELTAAHRTLPLGTEVRVTNLANHRAVVVRINDRGPAVKGRIIDLSPRAAAAIGLRAKGKGITRVRLDVVREAATQSAESAPDRSPDRSPTGSGNAAASNRQSHPAARDETRKNGGKAE